MYEVCLPKKGGNKPYGHIRKHLEEAFATKSLFLITEKEPVEAQVTALNFVDTKELFILINKPPFRQIEEITHPEFVDFEELFQITDTSPFCSLEGLQPFADLLTEKFGTIAFVQKRSADELRKADIAYTFGFSSRAKNVVGTDFLAEEFARQFKESFGSMGFRLRGKQEFIRIVNDQVVQSALMTRKPGGGWFEIQFSCFPIYYEWFVGSNGRHFAMRHLCERLRPCEDDWWDYINGNTYYQNSEIFSWTYDREDYAARVNEAISSIEQVLIPIFRSITTYDKDRLTPEEREREVLGIQIIQQKFKRYRVSTIKDND